MLILESIKPVDFVFREGVVRDLTQEKEEDEELEPEEDGFLESAQGSFQSSSLAGSYTGASHSLG